MSDVVIVRLQKRHETDFLQSVSRSHELHKGWVYPPNNARKFHDYLAKYAKPDQAAFLIMGKQDNALVGVVNVSEIVMGAFKSAYLGYYSFVPYSGTGLMKQGMKQTINECFGEMKLNRLEANIQPENTRSIGLVKSLGFRKEGLSERYLKVGGKWRDHERWAIHRLEWRRKGAA